jgi:tetratricopeptide (TPR) repeat protein
VITGPADLSAIEIFRQSLLQNARRDFVDWPFVLAVFVFSWVLGWLVFLSEMVKQGEFTLPAPERGVPGRRSQAAAVVFLVVALAGVGSWLTTSPGTATVALGVGLALLAAIACAAVAILSLLNRPGAREIAALVATALILMAPVIVPAGGYIPALVMTASGGIVLWLLWDRAWRGTLAPAALAVLVSFVLGFGYVIVHAARYRSLLFVGGDAAADSAAQLRALEASQAGGLLLWFYAFVLIILFALAYGLSGSRSYNSRLPRTHANSTVAYATVAFSLAAALFMIFRSNMLPIQADMVFKRARPFDDQATRLTQTNPSGALESWDIAIAIYERALDLVPSEDFYYLFLGRAYLERAGISNNLADQTAFLTRAESILLQAQTINPLNTDHTANLARLNTRWYAATEDEVEREERLGLAEAYYQRALTLSPQNSIIRNELARLVLELTGDCDRALALYDESARIDPFYADTQLARGDAYVICSSGRSDQEQGVMLQTAAESLRRSLEIAPDNVLAWVQLANVYRQNGSPEQAFAAVEDARLRNIPAVYPPSELDFLEAQIAVGLGNNAEARRLAEQALGNAGNDLAEAIEAFLQEIGTESTE